MEHVRGVHAQSWPFKQRNEKKQQKHTSPQGRKENVRYVITGFFQTHGSDIVSAHATTPPVERSTDDEHRPHGAHGIPITGSIDASELTKNVLKRLP